jgi:tRNA G37 N-methylase Trm5
MNKIERAIADCKEHIKHLEIDRIILATELDAYRKQLDNLEKIKDNKNIPHHELFDKPAKINNEQF